MPFHQDWMIRQIEMLTQFVARVVFKKDYIQYEIAGREHPSETDLLHGRLKELLFRRRICEAEDLLFDSFMEGDEDYLILAVDFYQSLNRFSDKELEAANYSREEISEGLSEILRRFDIPLQDMIF